MPGDAPRHLGGVRPRHPACGQRGDELRDLLALVLTDLATLAVQLALVELTLRARRQKRADRHRQNARHRGEGTAKQHDERAYAGGAESSDHRECGYETVLR